MTSLLLESEDAITELLRDTKRIAVLGIKTEAQADQASFYVPKYLVDNGFDVVPVPVYYPEVTIILGRPVVRTVAEISPPVDMVNVFRRSKDLGAHLDDILRGRPKSVWLQQGIKDAAFAEKLGNAGIKVVQDRCLMVELRRRR
jgi:uncharacterized protein